MSIEPQTPDVRYISLPEDMSGIVIVRHEKGNMDGAIITYDFDNGQLRSVTYSSKNDGLDKIINDLILGLKCPEFSGGA